jgi:hypothetical protein
MLKIGCGIVGRGCRPPCSIVRATSPRPPARVLFSISVAKKGGRGEAPSDANRRGSGEAEVTATLLECVAEEAAGWDWDRDDHDHGSKGG